MGLPAKLTAEEQALVNKYALLKKKKKAALSQKLVQAPAKSSSSITPKKKDVLSVSPSKEPQIAPKDAKEKAKQLLASGQLKISKGNENRSFKRARGLTSEKKTKETTFTEAVTSTKDQAEKIENIRRNSYNKFVSAGDKKDSGTESRKFDHPRRQSNLFVSGFGLTRHIMDTSFHQFGDIKNIYFDSDRSHGYVTYHRYESAEKAIAELHGSMIENVTLRVMYARKRNYDDNRHTWRPRPQHAGLDDPDQSDSNMPSQKTNVPRLSTDTKKKTASIEKRSLVTYDDTFDF